LDVFEEALTRIVHVADDAVHARGRMKDVRRLYHSKHPVRHVGVAKVALFAADTDD
jgi:hypothetical protein